jgi:hypothetical protein
MSTIRATVKAGRIEAQAPADWPEGTPVEIQPMMQSVGNSGEESMSAEEIARTLAAMDRVEAFEMTAEEEAGWEAERRARKEWEKAHFAEQAEKLRRQWE